MKIAVNTRFLIKNKLEGIGWFSYEVLKRITRNHPEHEFYFYFDRPYDEEFVFSDNVTPVVLSPPARHPFLWYYWFEFALPKAFKKLRPDMFFSPDGFLSLSAKTKTLLVVHDIAYKHYPSYIPFLHRLYYNYFSAHYIKKAEKIITVSEFSKKDIQQHYDPDTKIDVVYNGANDIYHPLSEAEKRNIRDKYSGGSEYFLYVGSVHPRKNVLGLIRAFELFKKTDKKNIKLLLAGRKAWRNKKLIREYEQLQCHKDVIFLDHCSPEVLSSLLGSAEAMVYISLFEGFGIPLVEAMYAGVPVITSNVSSMPEVAGDAAYLVDPHSTQSIAGAMQKIINEPELKQELINKGKERKKLFSWDKSAEMIWNKMESML